MLPAAVALAARDGIESLTMRKLAEELGAGAMSLYHHVPPFETAEQGAAVAQAQVRQFAELAERQESAALADEFPYLAEVVAGHVAEVGYDFTAAFLYGLDLILDALEHRRETA